MFKINIIACGLFLLTLASVRAADVVSSQAPEAATYQIRNVQFGDLLRPKDANNAEGTPIVLYPAQPWKCMTWQLKAREASTAANSNSPTVFRIKNLFTAKTFCADVNADTTQHRVTQIRFPKNNDDTVPGWRFIGLGDGNYEIVDDKSGNAVTAMKDGGYEIHIVTAPWENQNSQKWRLEKIDPKDLTM